MRIPHLLTLLLAAIAPVFATPPALSLKLPDGARPTAIEVGAQGDVYLAGSIWSSGQVPAITDSFVARYDPRAGQMVYVTRFVARASFTQNGLAVDAAGAAYVTGDGFSDFPTTVPVTGAGTGATAIVAKLTPSGQITYAMQLIGASPTQTATYGRGIAVNVAGEAYITGLFTLYSGGLEWTATSGAAVSRTSPGFLAKLDAGGTKVLLLERGVGGAAVALDAQENIYLTGAVISSADVPITAGVYQSTAPQSFCGGFEIAISCTHQHVAKLDPTGTKLLYATFVTGKYGAQPSSIVADPEGHLFVAGSTASSDYPVTAGVVDGTFQITAQFPRPLNEPQMIVYPPLETGFVTELSADGSSLVFSTFLGGTQQDSVTKIRLVQNQIYVTGFARSPEFTGLGNVDTRCRPASYLLRLASDGKSIDQVHSIPLAAAKNFSIDARTWFLTDETDFVSSIAFDPQGVAYQVGPAAAVYRLDPATPDNLACTTDSATFQTTDTTAPGELLSLLGTWPASSRAAADMTTGLLPTTLADMSVDFDGIPGRFLYSSPEQINVMVPYEIAGRSSTTMNIRTQTSGALQATQLLTVTPRRPSAFTYELVPGSCSLAADGDDLPLARNSDGTFNSCKNPAKSGSVVTLYLNGGGVPGNGAASGRISAEATAVNVPLSAPMEVVNFSEEPGSVSGVWRLDLRIPAAPSYGGVPTEGIGPSGATLAVIISIDGVQLQNRVLEFPVIP